MPGNVSTGWVKPSVTGVFEHAFATSRREADK